MRYHFVFLFLLTIPAACAPGRRANPSAAAAPIFRYVDLGSPGRFELGKPFDHLTEFATEAAPNTYRLRDDAFGGAESIVVITDGKGLVRRIRFEYGPGYDYAAKLADYVESLGAPTRKGKNKVVWNDGRTAFILWRATGKDFASGAEMRDE